MGAAMNGMALHGPVIPYGGTFLTFSDYMRPSMRLASLMHQRAIYVMTHDSIFLGEDGPTHQAVEHARVVRERRRVDVLLRPRVRRHRRQLSRVRSPRPSSLRVGSGESRLLARRRGRGERGAGETRSRLSVSARTPLPLAEASPSEPLPGAGQI